MAKSKKIFNREVEMWRITKSDLRYLPNENAAENALKKFKKQYLNNSNSEYMSKLKKIWDAHIQPPFSGIMQIHSIENKIIKIEVPSVIYKQYFNKKIQEDMLKKINESFGYKICIGFSFIPKGSL